MSSISLHGYCSSFSSSDFINTSLNTSLFGIGTKKQQEQQTQQNHYEVEGIDDEGRGRRGGTRDKSSSVKNYQQINISYFEEAITLWCSLIFGIFFCNTDISVWSNDIMHSLPNILLHGLTLKIKVISPKNIYILYSLSRNSFLLFIPRYFISYPLCCPFLTCVSFSTL